MTRRTFLRHQIARILTDLAKLLERDGFASVADAVGTAAELDAGSRATC